MTSRQWKLVVNISKFVSSLVDWLVDKYYEHVSKSVVQ